MAATESLVRMVEYDHSLDPLFYVNVAAEHKKEGEVGASQDIDRTLAWQAMVKFGPHILYGGKTHDMAGPEWHPVILAGTEAESVPPEAFTILDFMIGSIKARDIGGFLKDHADLVKRPRRITRVTEAGALPTIAQPDFTLSSSLRAVGESLDRYLDGYVASRGLDLRHYSIFSPTS